MFKNPDVRFVAVNTASWDAHKQGAQPVSAMPGPLLEAIDAALGKYEAPPEWLAMADEQIAEWHAYLDSWSGPCVPRRAAGLRGGHPGDQRRRPGDYILSAAAACPVSLDHGLALEVGGSFDFEYGYSTMGYEIAGAWGARIARPTGDVIVWVGDGSYLMMNSTSTRP